MPQPTSESRARAHAELMYERAIVRRKLKQRELKRGMRDITKDVESSAAIPRDTTNNGADARKSRSSDKLSRHMPDRAYVLSDTQVKLGDKTYAVRRSSSKLIVRNADGTPNATDTLALVARWEYHRASEGR